MTCYGSKYPQVPALPIWLAKWPTNACWKELLCNPRGHTLLVSNSWSLGHSSILKFIIGYKSPKKMTIFWRFNCLSCQSQSTLGEVSIKRNPIRTLTAICIIQKGPRKSMLCFIGGIKTANPTISLQIIWEVVVLELRLGNIAEIGRKLQKSLSGKITPQNMSLCFSMGEGLFIQTLFYRTREFIMLFTPNF